MWLFEPCNVRLRHPRTSSAYPLHLHFLSHKQPLSLTPAAVVSLSRFSLLHRRLLLPAAPLSELSGAVEASSSSTPVASGTAGPPANAPHRARCCPCDGKLKLCCLSGSQDYSTDGNVVEAPLTTGLHSDT